MPLGDALEFSNAMAALNCTALGARGHFASVDEARGLFSSAARRVNPEYKPRG